MLVLFLFVAHRQLPWHSMAVMVIVVEVVHCGLEQTRIETQVLGHLLVRLLVRSHCSLVRLLRTAHSLRSRAPLCSLVCFLAHFAHSLVRGTVNDLMAIYYFFLFRTTVGGRNEFVSCANLCHKHKRILLMTANPSCLFPSRKPKKRDS